MKYPKITNYIRGAVRRNEMTDTELAERTGIPYQTLQKRYRNPALWRFCEWGAVLRHVVFTEEELKAIGKEVKGV